MMVGDSGGNPGGHIIICIDNHMIFLMQFEINKHK